MSSFDSEAKVPFCTVPVCAGCGAHFCELLQVRLLYVDTAIVILESTATVPAVKLKAARYMYNDVLVLDASLFSMKSALVLPTGG